MLARQTGATPGPDTLEAPAWTTYQHGMNTKATELIAHLALLTQMTEIMDTFMSDIDVWLTPAVSTTACLTGEYDPRNYRVGDLSFWHQEMALYSFLPLPSVTGQPALVLPIQGSDHALPLWCSTCWRATLGNTVVAARGSARTNSTVDTSSPSGTRQQH